jgi:two-component sensor histidine kinase/integral membrane sensor domain MASE1
MTVRPPVPAPAGLPGPRLAGAGRYLLLTAALAMVYFLLARLGLSLAFATHQVSAIWPPTGLALAALSSLGLRVWPGIYAGAFLANALASEPIGVAACIACGNTLAGLVAAVGLRTLGFERQLQRSRDVVALIVVASGSAAVSATLGALSLLGGGLVAWSHIMDAWRTWWAGDTLGMLIFAPLLFTWMANPRPVWRDRQLLEFAAYVLALILVGVVVFAHPNEADQPFYQRSYTAFPILMWAGLRFGPRETVLGAVVLTVFAICGVLAGLGPFATGGVDERLILLDTFIGVIGCTALLLGAASAERRGAEQRLRRAHDELEQRVRDRTVELATAVEQLREANATLNRSSLELVRRGRENETLLREIHHRVKNNMQVIISLLTLQAQDLKEPHVLEFVAESRERVRSMALVHEQLYRSKDLSRIPIESYLRLLVDGLLQTQGMPEIRQVICAPEITLPVDQAIPCGLIVTELVTNALKHAFPEQTGTVRISLTEGAEQLELLIADDGVGLPEETELAARDSFGFKLVAMLAEQLQGSVQITRGGGTAFLVRFPRSS